MRQSPDEVKIYRRNDMFVVQIHGKRFECDSLADAHTALCHFFGYVHPKQLCIVCHSEAQHKETTK